MMPLLEFPFIDHDKTQSRKSSYRIVSLADGRSLSSTPHSSKFAIWNWPNFGRNWPSLKKVEFICLIWFFLLVVVVVDKEQRQQVVDVVHFTRHQQSASISISRVIQYALSSSSCMTALNNLTFLKFMLWRLSAIPPNTCFELVHHAWRLCDFWLSDTCRAVPCLVCLVMPNE